MVLRKSTTHTFDRRLYAGEVEKVRILKRDDDQRQGTVRAVIVYGCRRSQTVKTGETIQGEMSSDHRTTWHIPVRELKRVGIAYLNAIDRIEQIVGEETSHVWQPESTTSIMLKLFGNWYTVDCLRVDFTRAR